MNNILQIKGITYSREKFVKILAAFFILTILFLFFYSFTQIDLNLTLSRWLPGRVVERFFQQIGYFNRLLSVSIYYAILAMLFISYIGFLLLAGKKAISKKFIWKLAIFTAVLLLFSYNAFSYDIFNYIFDARILTYYHQNPYFHKGLDFPQDHMLTFMRWTHRVYPYGPAWLLLTVPLSFAGGQLFLITFFIFKALMAASFIGTMYFIEKISEKFFKEDQLQMLVFFCFNPLVIIESLVSGHIDIVMIFFAIWSTYFLLNKRYVRSYIVFIFSVLIKFATGFLLPVYLLSHYFALQKRHIHAGKFFLYAVIFLVIAVIVESWRSQFQPWYLLILIPYAAFICKRPIIYVSGIVMPFFALLEYAPYIQNGNWNPPIPMILNLLTILGIICSFIVYGIGYLFYHRATVK